MIPVTRVWERLYMGSWNDAEALFRSNPSGITTVISLCEDKILRRNSGISYTHIPIADATPVPVGQYDAIMDALIENIRLGSVLIHCHHGVSRAPVLTAAYMDVVGCKNIDAALGEIKNLRPIIHPSDILLTSVKGHLR